MIDWLADTLLATSLLMMFVLLVREPVRRQFGPAAAYGLWLIPALRMMMPPLTTTVERAMTQPEPIPFGSPRPAPSLMPAAEPSLVEQFGGWESVAVSVWGAGASAMLLCGFLIYRWQRREVLRDSVQIARVDNIRIVRSTAVRGPMAFGIFDRVIALPIDFDDRYDPHERRLALDHELAHHRSGDLVANHFAFALLCLHWFNPLAWVSHTAFRFDQEAACDARILDKVSSPDRAVYAQAVAKAASGRALLFAGALDRPSTLQRRLRSMLTSPGTGRRIAGKALIALNAATAVPLTASWATHYVYVPAVAPLAPVAEAQSAAMTVPHGSAALTPAASITVAPASATALTPVASMPVAPASAAVPDTSGWGKEDGTPLPGGIKLGKGSTAFFANDDVLIHDKIKRLEQLTPSERSQLRAAILRSQREFVRERAELPRQLAELRREADRARSGELRRAHMRDIEDLRRDLAEVDSRAARFRAEGDDPAKRKAEIVRDLRRAEATDIAREEREAIEDGDPNKRLAELRADEEQMVRLLARLDQLDRR